MVYLCRKSVQIERGQRYFLFIYHVILSKILVIHRNSSDSMSCYDESHSQIKHLKGASIMKYLSDSLPQTACIPLSFGNEAPEQALGILSPEPASDEEKREYAKQTAIRHAMSIEDYRLYLSAQNMSENTIHVYAYAIRQFFALYHEITYSNLKLYKVFLLEHYKPQTVNLRIRALNSYIEFKKLNPGKIPMVRIQHKNYLDNVISEADYEYLKNCLLRDEKYLYYFIIRFMAATGARVSEVIQFEAEDIFTGYKDIYSKGNKVRRIYVPKALQKDAIAWLKAIRQERGFVFLNRYGNPITPGGIRGQLKNMALAYGMNPEVVHPHSFRHRFAKSFIEKCGDISLLSDLLGHKNLETTRIYLRRSSSEQYEIINKVVDW